MPIKNLLMLLGVCVILLIQPGCTEKEIKPNILLITIDTLRRDHLGCYGYTLDTSPFIDRLASEGLRFKNAVTPLPLTDPSHASILTSLHPLIHQVTHNSVELNKNIQTIAEALKENGYYTIGAVGVKHLSGQYNFSQGFDVFSDDWDPEIKDWNGEVKFFNGKWQRVAKSINESLLKAVEDYLDKNNGKPLFIWAHYYDPHFPYIARSEIDLGKKKMWFQYDKEIRYTNNHIEKLYRFLEKKGMTEKMVTCITADHGEQFGEHGSSCDHKDFYSETAFVPLIFHGYKIPKNQTVDEYVSTMDIGVTLLKLANLNFVKPVTGVPLLNTRGDLMKIPEREHVIIGNLSNVRSIQLISAPYSLILNFEFFHEFWYITRQKSVPENRFKTIKKEWIQLSDFDKKNYYEIRAHLPYSPRKGFNFALFRFDVKKDMGLIVGHKLIGGTWSEGFRFKDKKTATVTAFYPLGPLDKIITYVGLDEGTEISGLRYAFISEEEFLNYAEAAEKLKNKKIFEKLVSPRKSKKIDELYNLNEDIAMVTNLLKKKKKRGKYTKRVIEGKKKIYEFLETYYNEMKKMLGTLQREKVLTQKEKEMLKSLGYL